MINADTDAKFHDEGNQPTLPLAKISNEMKDNLKKKG